MKAAVLNQIGDAELELRDDVTTTAVGPEEVRIRVRATGVCHSDISAMDGTLPALAPGVLGHEGAGEVVETGGNPAFGYGKLDLDGMITTRITLDEVNDALRDGANVIRQMVVC
ncbi:alcohol dehydrogenase catalytic domain-containing protein [Actinophytocola algeriensis]|uniref:alcohol dehydrogenase n=1 Tax=Actinophytocola algeriensis TaxID=1768010 RepID=A0A7W7VBM4_9PSEU|nr:alcohol dehydrogenase catalytic domain-containing protein [Actinophytocola algeriensis]MBB4904126.1 Zn-dependent alcohol dehydrogenase [Actinophytocola algeriensis]MBE1477017.1 Zn-dependent alcohol dehydrogenase [Actinophytocola algeriensis]